MEKPLKNLPFKVSVLVFLRNSENQLLLLERTKAPNKGLWSPIGGKLHMPEGESPFECAVRETQEEAGLQISHEDLHLFAMISEKAYEDANHWLLFLFNCKKTIDNLPEDISEGRFAFFSREKIDALNIPEMDKSGLWPIYDQYRDQMVVMRADCEPGKKLEFTIDQIR